MGNAPEKGWKLSVDRVMASCLRLVFYAGQSRLQDAGCLEEQEPRQKLRNRTAGRREEERFIHGLASFGKKVQQLVFPISPDL